MLNRLNFGQVVVLTTLLLLILEYGLHSLTELQVPILLFVATVVFGLLTYGIYRFLSKSNAENPKRFVSHFMGAIGIKLFASLILVVVYLMFGHQESKMILALGVMFVYMTFNILLIKKLLPEVRKNP